MGLAIPPPLSLVGKALASAYRAKHGAGVDLPTLGLAIMLSQSIRAEGAWASWTEGAETLWPFQGTNNFGAMHATSGFARAHALDAGYGMVAFLDHAPGAYIARMAVYPSLLEGARAYLDLVEREGVDLAAVTEPADYAAQLYVHNYFEGFHAARTPLAGRAAALAQDSWTADDRANIADYAAAIGAGLGAGEKALAGADAEPGDPSAPTHGPPFASLAVRLTPAASYAPHTIAHARALLGTAAVDPPAGAISLADAQASPDGEGVWLFPEGAIVARVPKPAPPAPVPARVAAGVALATALLGAALGIGGTWAYAHARGLWRVTA